MAEMTQEEMIAAQKAQCPFCKIIKGEIPSKKVYEDEHMLAILDINPAAKGHMLVMPKEHYPILPLIPPEIFTHMFVQTKKLVSAMHKGLIVPRVTTFIANGAAAGQQSPHFLYHLIPREEGDGLEQLEAKGGAVEQKDIAQSISANMQAIMRNHIARTQGEDAPLQEPVNPQEKLKAIISLLQQEPELHAMLVNSPEQVEAFVAQNPTLQEAFAGVNLLALSEMLQQQAAAKQEAATKEPKHQEQESITQTTPAITSQSSKTIQDLKKPKTSNKKSVQEEDAVPDAAMLSNEELEAYLERKPILKQLLFEDVGKLMEMLETNTRLQQFFANITPQELVERLAGSQTESQEEQEEQTEVDFDALAKYLGGNK